MAEDVNTGKIEKSSSRIDVKRIAYRALQYWYVIALCLVACLSISFYNNRYTQRIYPVTTSIIIREKEATSGAEILYKNALVDQDRNYLNEPYIIRSYPLILRVIEDLNFNIAFYNEGYILTTEAYNSLPVKVILEDPSSTREAQYIFRLASEINYSLEYVGNPASKVEFKFGAPIAFDGMKLQINRYGEQPINDFIDVPYIFTISNPYAVAGEYVGKLNVDWAEEGAGVINLSVNGPNPGKEIDFLNGLVENYQSYDLEKKNLTASRTVDFIKGQLTKISDSLRLFEGQLQQFKKGNRTSGDMSMEGQRIFSKIEALELQKTELQLKNNYYNYLKKYLTESSNLDQIILPTSMGITDPVLTTLISKIVELQLELKLFMNREMPTNPLLTSRMNRLAELKREVLESMASLKSTDKIKLDFLNAQISSVEKQISYLPSAERQLISIQRNYSLLENLYVFLMQKMSEAEISRASNTSDIIMVNPPMQAGGAIFPKVNQNYMLGVMAGLGLPLLLFVILELLDNRIQSREDIEKITSIPFIGGIGHKKGNLNLEVLKFPKSSISEAFRSLRSNLIYFTGKNDKAAFLITSSISGEGKTFTSVNLASIFSLSGKKTLIVGADMRKPKLYMDFGVSNNIGLSTYLAGIAEFSEVIQSTGYPNLDIVSGGPVPPNPSELLLSQRMREFLQKAKDTYDYLIIDTPPMGIVTDAFALTEYVDHTIFLVRQDYTPKDLLWTTHDYYASGKVRNISIVFNDIYRSGPGYGYGYGYAYVYGYGARKGKGKSKNGYGYYQDN